MIDWEAFTQFWATILRDAETWRAVSVNTEYLGEISEQETKSIENIPV